MTYEAKPGSFSLFKNDKQGNEARPDYTGTGKDLEGNDIRVSAWIKESVKGKFMSCRFEYPRIAKHTDQKPENSAKPKQDEFISAIDEGDIPF